MNRILGYDIEDMRKNKENVDTPEQKRSVRRTKAALRNGLIELMKTRSILRISVKEICDAADIGRSTFYIHYKSQYELLEEIETDCLIVFEEKLHMNQPLRKFNDREITQKFEKMLQFIADNSNSIQTLLNENGDIFFQRKFIHRLINYIKSAKNHYADNSLKDETSECYSVFVVHGAIALVQHWLNNGMHIPVSDLAKMLVILTREMRK